MFRFSRPDPLAIAVLALAVVLALLLLPALSEAAAPAPNPSGKTIEPTGHWEGSIEVPNTPVVIEIDIVHGAGGTLTGTFGHPDRHVVGLPLSNVVAKAADASVSFEIRGTPGGAFQGKISGDGKTMSGAFSMPASSVSPAAEFPFHLARKGDAHVAPIPTSPAIGKDLEGAWTGTLDVGGSKKTIRLELTNRPDGRSVGILSSEGLELPIANIAEKGSAVTLDVSAIGGSYSGTLAAGGKELAGVWTQGAFSGALTFQRAAAP